MAKRNAQSELNHDNWDQEDENEEAGEFKRASEEQMKVKIEMFIILEVILHSRDELLRKQSVEI